MTNATSFTLSNNSLLMQAGQSLTRSENGEDGLWKVVEEVHKDADRLFKMIGEAYAVLSDPNKVSHIIFT